MRQLFRDTVTGDLKQSNEGLSYYEEWLHMTIYQQVLSKKFFWKFILFQGLMWMISVLMMFQGHVYLVPNNLVAFIAIMIDWNTVATINKFHTKTEFQYYTEKSGVTDKDMRRELNVGMVTSMAMHLLVGVISYMYFSK